MDLSDLFSLRGKTAIITGADTAIGYSIAEFFAAAGANVIASSGNQEELREATEKLRNKGYQVAGISCNVEKPGELKTLVEKTVQLYAQIDILVNNARINHLCKNMGDMDMEVFDRLMDINVKAPYELSKLCLPFLRQSSNASIINIGATEGINPEPNLGLCGVSKAALIALTKTFAREWGDYRIRVNVICPGLTKTPSNEVLWSEDRLMVNRIKELPIKRMCESQEIAAMALFLASPASSYTTGSVMAVDGGLTM